LAAPLYPYAFIHIRSIAGPEPAKRDG
jgi:hypothetical protein